MLLGCIFQMMVGGDSRGSWAVFPRDGGRVFQMMVGIHDLGRDRFGRRLDRASWVLVISEGRRCRAKDCRCAEYEIFSA
jgi:hypothetical protein